MPLSERREIDPMLLHRMDQQDALLQEIRDKLLDHIKTEDRHIKAMDELVIVWQGSKIIIPFLITACGILGAAYLWIKDHVK